jgi:hypothetical protein
MPPAVFFPDVTVANAILQGLFNLLLSVLLADILDFMGGWSVDEVEIIGKNVIVTRHKLPPDFVRGGWGV